MFETLTSNIVLIIDNIFFSPSLICLMAVMGTLNGILHNWNSLHVIVTKTLHPISVFVLFSYLKKYMYACAYVRSALQWQK